MSTNLTDIQEGRAYTVWAGPNGKLTGKDMAAAVAWFTGTVGQPPKVAFLHPGNEALIAEAPQGIKVEVRGGILRNEVMMAAVEHVETYVRGIFSIERDLATEKAGGFFCQACCEGKPASERSTDARYCQGCYSFMRKERQPGESGHWEGDKFVVGGKEFTVAPVMATALDDANGPDMGLKGTSSNAQAVTTAEGISDNGGGAVTALVVGRVKVLVGQGLSSRKIADQLQAEGIKVSHMTVARAIKRLQGAKGLPGDYPLKIRA